MSTAFAATIPGPPVSWSRARSRNGQHFTSARSRDYREHVQYHVGPVIPRGWPVDARYAVVVHVYQPTRRRCDVDNFGKAILDALNPGKGPGAFSGVWGDDAQVDRLEIERHYDRDNPRVTVGIAVREPDA